MSAYAPPAAQKRTCREVRVGPFATGKVICSVDEINFTIPKNNREALKEMLDAEAEWTET
jgi:hypothetical protein